MGLVMMLYMFFGVVVGWGVLLLLVKNKGWVLGLVLDWEYGSKGWIVWVLLVIMFVDFVVSLGYLVFRLVRLYWFWIKGVLLKSVRNLLLGGC